MSDDDDVVRHRQIRDDGFQRRHVRLTVAGELLAELLQPRQRASLAFDRLRLTRDAAARRDGMCQLVPTDIAIAQTASQQARQVLGTTVRFARKRDDAQTCFRFELTTKLAR